MIRLAVLNWTIDADPDATRLAYGKIAYGGPESCGCAHCRNFIAARQLIYDDAVLRAFAPLGIDPPIREAEISHSCADDRHFYSGWMFFVGRLHEGNLKSRAAVRLSQRFSIVFGTELWLVPEPFRDLSVVQLNFSAEVPWLLDEPWDS